MLGITPADVLQRISGQAVINFAAADARRRAFHGELLVAASATTVLRRNFGGPVLIDRLAPDTNCADRATTLLLMAAETEAVTCRKVRLHRVGTTLSHATLWYAATRLPTDMARELVSTERPFGDVVRPLGLRRTTMSAHLCGVSEPNALQYRALLADQNGRPMAVVDEIYGWALFAS